VMVGVDVQGPLDRLAQERLELLGGHCLEPEQ
jgi:hypothetical protein